MLVKPLSWFYFEFEWNNSEAGDEEEEEELNAKFVHISFSKKRNARTWQKKTEERKK